MIQAGLQSPAPVYVDSIDSVRVLVAAAVAIAVLLLILLAGRPSGATPSLKPQG